MSSSRRQGFSLPEIMIASAIMILLLVLLGQAFRSSLEYYRRTERLVDLENQAMVCLRAMYSELGQSTPNLVEIVEQEGVVFPSIRNEESLSFISPTTGKFLWQGLTCYSRETQDGLVVLVRRFRAYSASDDPLFTPWMNLAQFRSSSLRPRVLARRVQRFEVSRIEREGNERSDFLQVILEVQTEPSWNGQVNALELQTRIFPRN